MSTDTYENDRQSRTATESPTDPLTSVLRAATRHEHALWLLALAALAADLLTTYDGLRRGFVEGNPVVRSALADGGFAAFGALKLAAVGMAASVWAVVPRPNRVVVPVGLALPWGVTAAVNAVAIVT
jgi:hypothetical protein